MLNFSLKIHELLEKYERVFGTTRKDTHPKKFLKPFATNKFSFLLKNLHLEAVLDGYEVCWEIFVEYFPKIHELLEKYKQVFGMTQEDMHQKRRDILKSFATNQSDFWWSIVIPKTLLVGYEACGIILKFMFY